MGYEKNFDAWNEKKKIIHERKPPTRIQSGDVWWCSIGVNVGHEEDGKNEWLERPVCIIRRFGSELVWIVPTTTQHHEGPYYVHALIGKRENWIMITHVHLLSTRRLYRKVGSISSEALVEICDKIADLFKTTPPLQ